MPLSSGAISVGSKSRACRRYSLDLGQDIRPRKSSPSTHCLLQIRRSGTTPVCYLGVIANPSRYKAPSAPEEKDGSDAENLINR